MDHTPPSLLESLRTPRAAEVWPRFVHLYSPLLFYWAKRLGLQDQDAADLVQDVFMHLLDQMPKFAYDRNGSFRSWLRTVIMNKWREKQRRSSLPVADNKNVAEQACGMDPAEALWEREYQQHVARLALCLMQSEFQETTWKACWEVVVNDRSAEEVARELNLTLGAVYAAKSRVLRRLRHELDGLLD